MEAPAPSSVLLLRKQPLVWILSLLYPLIFTAISLSWNHRLPDGWQYSGYMQGDQPSYTAWAREVFERGNGFLYANPWDAASDAPRIYSNLAFIVLAALYKVLPLDWLVTWELLRIAGGFAMAMLLFKLLALLQLPPKQTLFLFALTLTGGGVASLIALFGSGGNWLETFIYIEDGRNSGAGYGWWLPNIFRQPLYPLETLYHAMLYAAALVFLSKRKMFCLPLLALLWWMHPITAVLATTVLGLAAVGEFVVASRATFMGREAKEYLLVIVGIGLIGIGAVAYNRMYIPSFPSGKSFVDQALALATESLRWEWTIESWGWFLIAGLGALFVKGIRSYLVREPIGRFILAWLVAVFLWTHNDWFLRHPIQPMHFTRGHVFLGLILLIGIGLKHSQKYLQFANRRYIALFSVVIVLLGAMDNILFSARMASIPPRPYQLAISPSQADILSYFESLPSRTVIHCLDPFLSGQIVSRTPHLVVMGDRAHTPFHDEKAALTEALFAQGDRRIIDRFTIQYLIVPKSMIEQMPMAAGLRYFELARENEDYLVMARKLETF